MFTFTSISFVRRHKKDHRHSIHPVHRPTKTTCLPKIPHPDTLPPFPFRNQYTSFASILVNVKPVKLANSGGAGGRKFNTLAHAFSFPPPEERRRQGRENEKSSSPRAQNVQSSTPCETPRYAVVWYSERKASLAKARRDLAVNDCPYRQTKTYGWGNERALNSRIVCKTGDPPETRYGEWGRGSFFSKKRAKIVDVSGKDRAARPLANKCHDRVRKLDEQS